MGMMRKLVSALYRSARIARDLEVYASGNPRRILRRMVNKKVIRHLGARVQL